MSSKQDLVDTSGIANSFNLKRRYVTDRLTKAPDFPRPVIDRSRRLRFWSLTAVDDYMRGRSRRPAMSSADSR